jgi:hypothetical protein
MIRVGELPATTAARYICKRCGAESPTGIGYAVGIVGPLPAPAADCPEIHGATWPATLTGRAVWACCVSSIGPACQHVTPAAV